MTMLEVLTAVGLFVCACLFAWASSSLAGSNRASRRHDRDALTAGREDGDQ